MSKNRFDNFSDAVIAIIITIMVLRMKAPDDGTWRAVLEIHPLVIGYAMSFLVVAIFWVSHNQLFQGVEKIGPKIVWANLNLLFWMSLIPLVMVFMGEHHKEALPVSAYALVFGMTYLAFTLLRKAVAHQEGENYAFLSRHSRMLRQNILATLLYFISIPLAHVSVYIAYGLFCLIPLSYFLVVSKNSR